MTAPHYPVMLPQVLEATQPGPGVHVVDGTFGAGGYSRAFLDAGAKVTAFDRDPSARQFAEPLLGQSNFEFVQARFSELSERMAGVRIDAVVLDLGVSSMQLDQAERGFSFMRDGPLDMRMSGQGPSAAELVNQSEAAELARILYVYGEERQSRRIAAAIVRRLGEGAEPRSTLQPEPSRPSGLPSTRNWPSSRPVFMPQNGRWPRAVGWWW